MNTGSSVNCSWCGCSRATFKSQARGFDCHEEVYDLFLCEECGLVRTDPYLTGSALAKYYTHEYYGSADAKFSPALEYVLSCQVHLRAKALLKRIALRGHSCKFLDVGAGRGSLLKALSAYGVECYGLEREEFPVGDDAYVMLQGDLVDLSNEEHAFDAVSMWHVLEHLEKPREAIIKAFDLIRPGGVLILAVPNISSWQARLFGSSWFHLDLPRHLNHFSLEWFERELSRLGHIEEVLTLPTIEQSVFGFIQSTYNRILPNKCSNLFYSLMQRRAGAKDHLKLVMFIVLSALIFPFAVAEHFSSALFRRNASVVLLVRKTDGKNSH